MPLFPGLDCKLPKCKDKVQVAMTYPPYTRHRDSHYMTLELRKFICSFIHSFIHFGNYSFHLCMQLEVELPTQLL